MLNLTFSFQPCTYTGTDGIRIRSCLGAVRSVVLVFDLASPSRPYGPLVYFLFPSRLPRRGALPPSNRATRIVPSCVFGHSHKVYLYTCSNISDALSAYLNIGAGIEERTKWRRAARETSAPTAAARNFRSLGARKDRIDLYRGCNSKATSYIMLRMRLHSSECGPRRSRNKPPLRNCD